MVFRGIIRSPFLSRYKNNEYLEGERMNIFIYNRCYNYETTLNFENNLLNFIYI